MNAERTIRVLPRMRMALSPLPYDYNMYTYCIIIYGFEIRNISFRFRSMCKCAIFHELFALKHLNVLNINP